MTTGRKLQRRLTLEMRKALVSARDRGGPTAHLRGQSEFGGWEGTRAALQRRGLLDRECKITDAGRAAIAAVTPGAF